MSDTLTLDEIAGLCARSAMSCGYPDELARILSEMVVWLERHRLPGMAALAERLERAEPFDMDAASPQILDNGQVSMSEPLFGGMFLNEHFDGAAPPTMVEGPETGTLILVPFLAMAAHQHSVPLEIAFLGSREHPNEGARLTYRDGKSAFDGRTELALQSRVIGFEKPAFLATELQEALSGSLEVDDAVVERLKAVAGRPLN